MGPASGNGARGVQARAEMAGHEQVTWRKSSWSTYNGNCVEVAHLGDGRIGVRDTKDQGSGAVLAFGSGPWREFTNSLKRGDLDLTT